MNNYERICDIRCRTLQGEYNYLFTNLIGINVAPSSVYI